MKFVRQCETSRPWYKWVVYSILHYNYKIVFFNVSLGILHPMIQILVARVRKIKFVFSLSKHHFLPLLACNTTWTSYINQKPQTFHYSHSLLIFFYLIQPSNNIIYHICWICLSFFRYEILCIFGIVLNLIRAWFLYYHMPLYLLVFSLGLFFKLIFFFCWRKGREEKRI